MMAARLENLRLLSLLGCIQKGLQFFPVLGKHPGELNSISYLGIAGDYGCGNQQGVIELQLHIQDGSWREGKHSLDIASACTEIRGRSTDWALTALQIEFYGNAHLQTTVAAPILLVPFRRDGLIVHGVAA
jgi:hypothetical protein